MKKIALTLAVLGTTLLAGFYTAPAHAQATRTWVSGVGDDANPCSRTAPCKTFAGAISKTAAGGEIDALDPGGFGALTITKSITLDGGGGQVASVLVAGTNGIVVSAASNDVVVLRNLRLQGNLGNAVTGTPGLDGIKYISGALVRVMNCNIDGFSLSGIEVATSTASELEVSNTTITNVKVAGITLGNTASHLFGSMDNSQITYSFGAGISTSGVGNVNFTVAKSVISGTITTAFSATTTGAVVRASNNNAYNNTNVFSATGGGVTQTAGNNRVGGSGGNITQQ